MKKLLFFVLIINCSLLNVEAQTQFQRAMGGTIDEYAFSTIQTTDGGYIMAGQTTTFTAGNNDMYIVKLNAGGTLEWSKSMGGTGFESGLAVIQTLDGGYAAVGIATSFGNFDMYIVKLNASGVLQWNKTIGGTNMEWARSIVQTPDGGFAVAGQTISFGAGDWDMYIVKIDSIGTLQWSKTIGGTGVEAANSIIYTTDGGYALAGSTTSFGAGGYDMYIVKLDSGGTLQWSKTLGGTGDDGAKSIINTTDGGYALGGGTLSFSAGFDDMYIVKLNSTGTLQWTRTVGGINPDAANSIIQTTDGGYVLAGFTRSFGAGNDDMYIVKLDAGGSLQLSKTAGGGGSDGANSIIQTTDGAYVTAGQTTTYGAGINRDMYMVKLDVSGNSCGNLTSPTSLSGTGGTLGSPPSTATFQEPAVTTPTPTIGSGGTLTIVCTVTGIQPGTNEIPSSYSLSQNYPNPFNPVTKISYSLPEQGFVSLKIYDIQGREIETLVNEIKSAGNNSVNFDGTNFPSGVYLFQFSAENYTETKKMMLLK